MTDTGNANAGARRGTPRWMLVALFVSLALNLIVDFIVTLLDTRLRHG